MALREMREKSATGIVVDNPKSFSLEALREILRYQIFSTTTEIYLRTYSIEKGSTQPKPKTIHLSSDTLHRARDFSGEQRKEFLDHWAEEIHNADEFIIVGIRQEKFKRPPGLGRNLFREFVNSSELKVDF